MEPTGETSQRPSVKLNTETASNMRFSRWFSAESRRVGTAIFLALLVGKLYAGVHPWSYLGCGPGVWFSPTQCHLDWQSAMTLVVEKMNAWVPPSAVCWRLSYASGVVMIPTLIAVLVYAWLTISYGGARHGQPRCRRCTYMLRGLSRPQCPECGECI